MVLIEQNPSYRAPNLLIQLLGHIYHLERGNNKVKCCEMIAKLSKAIVKFRKAFLTGCFVIVNVYSLQLKV
jgi:hypothetical protein